MKEPTPLSELLRDCEKGRRRLTPEPFTRPAITDEEIEARIQRLDPELICENAPPECADCKDTGWLEHNLPDDPEGSKPRLRQCPCVPRKNYSHRMAELDLENARFRGLTLDTYEPDNEEQAKALWACKAWAREWPDVDRGIVLMGPVGVGKTGLLWATVKAAGLKEYEIPYILRAQDLAEAPIYASFSEPDMPTRNKIIARYVQRRLLVFDDLGTGKRSESTDGAYFRLLDKRHLACAPTLVTTNYTDKAIQLTDGSTRETCRNRIGGRLYSRLRQSCDFYDITGDDRRWKGEAK